MAKMLRRYRNGNYTVTIYDDGTKIRFTEEDKFKPEFAENCDVKITDKCDGGCSFCYENSTPLGKHARLFDISIVDDNNIHVEPAQEWLKNLHPGTELAINGNDLSHPALNPLLPWLLIYLQNQSIIVNLTINQRHFMQHYEILKHWIHKKYIYGLGVSLVYPNDEFIDKIKEFPNAVIHTIAGVLSAEDIELLKDKDLKILILGYKDLGRGASYKENHYQAVQIRLNTLKRLLPDMVNWFKVVSFDNLALEQLNVKDLLFKEKDNEWEQFYMGNDGEFTFYIDAVDEQYAMNSCVPKEQRLSGVGLSVDEMFYNLNNQNGKII